MAKKLPARPNLEHLRSQAKTLLARMRDGDEAAARTFIAHLPEARRMTPPQVRAAGFRLADAQAALARKNGFGGWPGLARYVERLRSLEGTWAFRSLEIDGHSMPGAAMTSSRLLIDGDRFRMESPEGTYEGVFDIDIEKAPHTIDIDFIEGPEAGHRSEGIFELKGDRLTICLGVVGSTRPATFATAPGSGHALEELERVAHARPDHVDGGAPPPPSTEPDPTAGDPSPFTDEITPTLQKLQGEWRPTQLVSSGSALAPDLLSFGSRTMTGTETRVVFGGQTMVHAKVRIHESSSPIAIDYLNLSGKKRTVSLGLLQWIDDEVLFCTAAAGESRPADFTCEKGSGRTLSRWKRK